VTLLTEPPAGAAGPQVDDDDIRIIEDDIAVVPDAAHWWPRLSVRTALAAASCAFLLLYVVIALLRLRHPYEVEWIEGGMVNHVAWLRDGHQLYGPPSLTFTPDIYTPLYFYVAAALSFVTGINFFTLRLVSFVASLALFLAVGKLARRETNDRLSALVAAGLLAACYRIGGAWLDIAREDTLCLALLFWGLVVARDARNAKRGVLAGALLSLAFLTKQVALLPALGIGLFLLVARRGRTTFVSYALTIGVGIAGTSVVFDRLTDGWYGFYVWDLPAHHEIVGREYTHFFTRDLLLPLAFAIVVGLAGLWVLRRRSREAVWFHVVVGGALVAAAYSARLHSGGYDNVLLPAYAEIAVLFGIGVQRVLELPRRTWLGFLAAAACLLQFAHLVYSPTTQMPTSADQRAGDATIEALRNLPQPVYMPGHPWYLEMAGLPPGAQSAAIGDVLRADVKGTGKAMAQELWTLVEQQRFASIVVDSGTGFSYLPDNLCRYYRPVRPLTPTGDVVYPRTGTMTGPAEVWLPRTEPGERDCWGVGNWTIGRDGK